jgi:hypothetical protein
MEKAEQTRSTEDRGGQDAKRSGGSKEHGDKLSEEMYKKVAEAQAQQKQAAAGAAPGADAADGAGATEGGDDDVIDADYEVKE